MFILDDTKRAAGHYAGLLEWLEKNIGYDGAAWEAEVKPTIPRSDRMIVHCIAFMNPAHETLTKLVWQ